MRMTVFFILMSLLAVSISGCGETMSGIGKDASRMGRGVSTFLFRQ